MRWPGRGRFRHWIIHQRPSGNDGREFTTKLCNRKCTCISYVSSSLTYNICHYNQVWSKVGGGGVATTEPLQWSSSALQHRGLIQSFQTTKRGQTTKPHHLRILPLEADGPNEKLKNCLQSTCCTVGSRSAVSWICSWLENRLEQQAHPDPSSRHHRWTRMWWQQGRQNWLQPENCAAHVDRLTRRSTVDVFLFLIG